MDSQIVQLKKNLQILHAHRYLFLLVAATLSLLIVSGTILVPKKYKAESTVFIEQNVVNKLMKGLTISPSMNDRIRVLRYHMLSRDIISRVLKELDKDVAAGGNDAFERLIKFCQKQTKIKIRGKDIFFVSFVNTDPQFAKDYINTLVTTYVEENIASKREESFGAGRFLAEQVSFYKDKLDKLEDELYNYRRKTGLFSTVTEESILAEIKECTLELRTLKLQKNELVAKVDTIGKQLQRMKHLSATNPDAIGSADPANQLIVLRDKLRKMLLVYNERYPGVIKLKEQIVEAEKQQTAQSGQLKKTTEDNYNPIENPIFVDLKMRMNAAQSDLQALQSRESELQNQVAKNKQILENFPKDKKVLADMERERAMNKNVYETLLGRVGVAEVSKQMEVADKATTFRIIDPAILPTLPVGTKRLVKMLLGLCVGIGAGIGAVVAREMLNDTVKSADEIRAMGVTVLAEISLMHNADDIRRTKKLNLLVYSYTAVCLLGVAAFIGHDLLGMTVLDRFVANTHLDTMFADLVRTLRS